MTFLRVVKRLDGISEQLETLTRKMDTIMATEQNLSDDLDAITAAVVTVAATNAAELKTIADLKAQIAAGTPVTQAQLDALEAHAQAIKIALTPVVPPPTPPAA